MAKGHAKQREHDAAVQADAAGDARRDEPGCREQDRWQRADQSDVDVR